MKLATNGFTFAELIIAVAIIALVSFFSVGTYYQMEESTSLQRSSTYIQEIFHRLDDEVRSGQITSYSATLAADSPGMIVEVDTYGSEKILTLTSFDWDSGSGKVFLTKTLTGAGFILSKNDFPMLSERFSYSNTGSFQVSFPINSWWEIRGDYGESFKNGLRPISFDYSDQAPASQRAHFVGFSGSTQTGGMIINMRGSKSHTVTGASFPIELRFERKGAEYTAIIE